MAGKCFYRRGVGPFAIPEPHDSLTNLTPKKSRLFSPKFLLANINELTNCRNLREEHAKSDRISKLEGNSERNSGRGTLLSWELLFVEVQVKGVKRNVCF